MGQGVGGTGGGDAAGAAVDPRWRSVINDSLGFRVFRGPPYPRVAVSSSGFPTQNVTVTRLGEAIRHVHGMRAEGAIYSVRTWTRSSRKATTFNNNAATRMMPCNASLK